MVAGVRLYATFNEISKYIHNKIENPERYGTFFPIQFEVKEDATIEVLLVADILDENVEVAEPDRRLKLEFD